MSKSQIICGDCLEVLPRLPKAKMIFADPPDNLGLKYEGFVDKWPSDGAYLDWLCQMTSLALGHADIFWLSYHYSWDFRLKGYLWHRQIPIFHGYAVKPYIWWFTFGQHRDSDNGNCFRPLLRFMKPWAQIYPDAIREPSARQRQYHDKRANAVGRVPGDVWDGVWQESRVCGTFKEKRRWHLNQHPEALMKRIILLSCRPGDLVIDLCAGTGTTLRVCKALNIDCIGIEISKFYCEQIIKEAAETGVKEVNQAALFP